MELFGKLDRLLEKGIGLIFKPDGKTDPNNELVKQLYSKLGIQLELLPYEIKEYVRQGYLINPHVYTVINKIIRPSSAIPHFLYEWKDDEKKVKLYKDAVKTGDYERVDFYRSKALKKVSQPELDRILEQPNDSQSWQEWCEQAMGFQLITGEEFIYGLIPSGYSQPTQLFNMPSQVTTIEMGDWRKPIKGYKIDYFGFMSETIDPEKVLHIKLMNPEYDGYQSEIRGLSPMSALCKVVKKSNDSAIAQMRILQNGHPVGILSNETERGMDDTAAKDLKRKWRRTQQGPENINEVLLTSLKLKWVSMGLTTADMQLMESDKADLETIARVYEIPLALVKNDASTYNNLIEAQKIAWMDARLPLLSRRRDALNRWLVKPYAKKSGKDLYIDYDITSIDALKRNDKEVVQVLKMEIDSGIISQNEAREVRGREPVKDPEADKLIRSGTKKTQDEENI